MMKLTHRESGERQPTAMHFIVVGDIEVRVADFVALWNGEDCLPALSPHEMDVERRSTSLSPAHHDFGDVAAQEDIMTFWRRWASPERRERKMRERKAKRIKSMIRHYHGGGQDLAVLSMGRVLAALSNGQMRFSDMGEFVARMAEPDVEEIPVIDEAVAEANHDIDQATLVTTPYVTHETASPAIAHFVDADRESVEMVIADRDMGLLPTLILQRALAGQPVSNDEYRELSMIRNIGSAPLVNLIQSTRVALFGLGMAAAAYGMSHPAEFGDWIYTGLGISGVGVALHHLYPSSARKPVERLAFSIRRYKAMYNRVAKRIAELKKTPLGHARVLLLDALVRGDNDQARQLAAFIRELDANPNATAQFNAMGSSVERDLESVEGTLQLIADFRATRKELPAPLE